MAFISTRVLVVNFNCCVNGTTTMVYALLSIRSNRNRCSSKLPKKNPYSITQMKNEHKMNKKKNYENAYWKQSTHLLSLNYNFVVSDIQKKNNSNFREMPRKTSQKILIWYWLFSILFLFSVNLTSNIFTKLSVFFSILLNSTHFPVFNRPPHKSHHPHESFRWKIFIQMSYSWRSLFKFIRSSG